MNHRSTEDDRACRLRFSPARGTGPRGPLAYDFEDSQSDPRQAVAIAQRFANDPGIVAELGDFSSTVSMAASPIYQRAGLLQCGFTNSHPGLTKGGDFMWSPARTSTAETPRLAQYAAKLGFKRVAFLYLDDDWDRASQATFRDVAPPLGIEVVDVEATGRASRTCARRRCGCATPGPTRSR